MPSWLKNLNLAKRARDKEADLGLSEDEVAFYDALTANDAVKEFMKDETLKKIARELTSAIRNNITIDWSIRKSAQAGEKLLRDSLRNMTTPQNK